MEGGIKTFFENDSIPVPAFYIKLFYSLSGYVTFMFFFVIVWWNIISTHIVGYDLKFVVGKFFSP